MSLMVISILSGWNSTPFRCTWTADWPSGFFTTFILYVSIAKYFFMKPLSGNQHFKEQSKNL
jgi:hypothetical protein